MEKKTKIMSLARFVFYTSVVIFNVWLLISLLSSCTEEVMLDPEQSHSNELIAVQFALGNVSYGGSEMVTRTPSPNPSEGGSSSPFGGDRGGYVIPVAEDIYMHTRLEVDCDINLRTATSNLKPGTKLRIVAYSNGNNYHAHADYTVNNNGELTDGLLRVMPGNYKFVAYSYNNAVLPAYNMNDDTVSDIDPSRDLLWGCYPETGTYPVTASSYEDVPITLSHLFSQMKIQVTTDDMPDNLKIIGIKNVSMNPGKKVNMKVKDRSFNQGSDAVQDFTWPTLNATTVVSECRTVYTGNAQSTIVQIGSVTLNGKSPFTNLTAIFDKQLKRGVSYTFKICFKKGGTIIDHTEPDNVTMFVGAFWKANQTGERLIRIPRPVTGNLSSIDGAWTATVVTGNDWIVLDREMTADKNVGWLNGANENNVDNGNDPNFDGKHRVNGTLTAVAGKMNAADPQIYFRIGLKSTFPATKSVPARYGMVLLTYKNNTLQHRIWIRQGEGADYLPGQNSGVKWSPYNLGHYNDALNYPNRFVKYPSQAGYFYQWGYSTSQTTPRPYHPVNPSTGAPSNWMGVPSESVYALNNACPNGYVVPTTNNLAGLLNSNNTWGYYADGWFDRRKIAGALGVKPAANSAVAFSNNNPPTVAYVGKLFFDAATNASLFFPAAGYRRHDTQNAKLAGELSNAGGDGMYMSSSSSNDQYDTVNMHSIDFYQGGNMKTLTAWPKTFGYSLRCVSQ